MSYDAKQIGEYAAYGIAVAYSFFKIIQNIYTALKDLITKKVEKQKENSVVVNVGNTPTIKNEDDFIFRFMALFFEQGKVLKAMYDMKSDILRDQMEYYFKHVQAIKISTSNVIVGLLKDADLDDVHFGTYFNNFENFMEIVESQSLTIFRRMCKENHFSKYTNSEYKELVNRNISIIEGNINELFRKRYIQRLYIKNFSRMEAINPLIRSALHDCFDTARTISIEKETKVKIMQEDFENEVSKLIGKKYTLNN